jgi:hypothetical protein
MLCRMAATSASVCGSLTAAFQFRGNATGGSASNSLPSRAAALAGADGT